MQLRSKLLAEHGIRVQENMGKYVLDRLNQTAPIRVIGGDARTGVPIVREIDPRSLSASNQKS